MRTVANWYLSNIIDECVKLGADENMLFDLVPGGVEALVDIKARFSDNVVLDIYESAKYTTGFAEIGLLVGNSISPGTVSVLEQASSSSKNLREAVMLNVRYPGLRQNIGQLNIKDTDQGFEILWETTYDDPEKYRSFVEAIMSRYYMFGQTFLVRAIVEPFTTSMTSISFRHKRPFYGDLYEKIFNCEVFFEAQQEKMVVPAYLSDMDLAVHSPDVLNVLFQRLDKEFSSLKTGGSTVQRMRASIREAIIEGQLSQEVIAQKLGISHRAFRRRLSDYKIPFRKIVSEERKVLCDNYIQDGKSFVTIAMDLGYNDQSAFNRAFKSWHGMAPSVYKRQLLNG